MAELVRAVTHPAVIDAVAARLLAARAGAGGAGESEGPGAQPAGAGAVKRRRRGSDGAGD